ncbi:META domain-containing protein [Actinopolymorpha alba]|uniref:META domain-containing protein n=1 Tax=Actinopolymorpha alba TaxID=533267 RepID=UPI00146DD0DA|nr:META domain-containing protein [Actinopolymorpha alba]
MTGSDGGAGEDLVRGRTFLSTQVTESGKEWRLVSSTRISLWFADDGRLVANAGCNTMQSPVKLAGGTLVVEDLLTTEMACNPPFRHDQDSWLASFLEAKPRWRLEGDKLTLTSGNTRIALLDRKVVRPDLPLEKTRWQVDTLIDGETASSVPGTTKAFLVFSDGKVTGSTGCNQLSGPAAVVGKTIEFGPIVTTKRACQPDVARLEQIVLAVLDGTVQFSIDSDRLRLDHPGGKGLVLTP